MAGSITGSATEYLDVLGAMLAKVDRGAATRAGPGPATTVGDRRGFPAGERVHTGTVTHPSLRPPAKALRMRLAPWPPPHPCPRTK